VLLKDIRPTGQTIVTMLGLEKPLKWKPIDGGLAVEIPQVPLDELPCKHAYTLKLTRVEQVGDR